MSHEAGGGEPGSPILLSFTELRGIHATLATITVKLDQFSILPGQIDKLAARVTELETDKAVRNARSGLYGNLAGLIWALVLVVFSAGLGAWLHYMLR